MAQHSGKTMTFATDLLPNENNIYNLGNANKQWNAYFAPKTIGGRNYIYSTPIAGGRSTIEGKTVVFNPNANNGDSYFYVKAARDIPVGIYTFSMDCEGLGANEVWTFGIISQNSGKVISVKNGRSALTFEVTTAITAETKIILDDISRPTTSTRVVFSNFMWEAATSPSDFSYAPEEIESTYAKKIASTKYGIAYYSDTNGTFAGTGAGTSGQYLKSNGNSAPTWATFSASTVGLGNVENTKLSTWTGSSNITTVGTISSGTWSGTAIANDKLANSSLTVGNKSISLGGSGTVHDILKTSTNIGTDTSWEQYDPGVYYVASSAAFTGTNNPENANTNNGITPYRYGQLIVSRAGMGGVAQFYISHNDSNNANYGIHYRTGWNNKYVDKWSVLLDSHNYTNYTVKKDGTGASGSWGISITGTAAKATADASGNTITSTYATKTEVNGLLAAANALIYKGVREGADTSSSNAYGALTPAANCGDTYKVSKAGFINGLRVEIGDMLICTTDNTAAATSANYTTIKNNWNIIQTSEGSVSTSSTSSTDNAIARFYGESGRIIQNSSTVLQDDGTIKFAQVTSTSYPANSAGLSWSGDNDGASIYYSQRASNSGHLVLQTTDDNNETIIFRHTKKADTNNYDGIIINPCYAQIYPAVGAQGSLGETNYRWKYAYINGTIYIGNSNYTTWNSATNGSWLTIGEMGIQRTSAGGGFYLESNGQLAARMWLQTLGTASTAESTSGADDGTQGALGQAYLALGNAISRGAKNTTAGANNSQGYLRLYGSDTHYTDVTAMTTSSVSRLYPINGIALPNNIAGILFRPDSSSYHIHISHQTNGNEALVAATQNAVTSFIFINGEKLADISNSRWQSLTPALQIKNNSVYIGELIPHNITPSYKFKVKGTSYFDGETTINGNLIFPAANLLDWNGATYRQRITITDDSTTNTAVFTFQQSTNGGTSYTDLFTIKDNGTVVAAGKLYCGATEVSLNGHTHSYLPLSGGTLTGRLSVCNNENPANTPNAAAIEIREVQRKGTDLEHTLVNAPRLGFHWGSKYWGQLVFHDTAFKFYDNTLTNYYPVYASTFYGNLSGNATTATSSKVLANQNGTYGTATSVSNRVTNTNIAHVNNGGVIHFKVGTATNGPTGGGNILHFYWDTSDAWDAQLHIPNNSANSMSWRASSAAGTWDSWRTILDTGNTTIPSTVPTLSWGTEATILTINGSAVKIKAMAKPTYSWSDIGSKPIEFSAYNGALNTNGWKTMGARTPGAKIYIAYNNNPASWNSSIYSSSIVFGCNDTKGLLDIGHNNPIVTFGGSTDGNSTDDNPKWYFKLSGTSGQTYTFPSTSKTLAATDGSNASGKWNISTLHASAAHYGTQSSYSSGIIKVKIKKKTSWMLTFTLRAYQYYKYEDYVISGYNYGTSNWYEPQAVLLGGHYTSKRTVTFGYDNDAVNNFKTLWVSIPANHYSGIDIFNVTNGFTQINDWTDAFEIIYEATSTGTVQTTKDAYRPWYRNEKVSSATTADSATTATTCTGNATTATAATAISFTAGNELILGNADGQAKIYINHRRVIGGQASGNTAITDYYFRNGNASESGVTIHAASFSGNAATASKLTDITSTDAAASSDTWRRLWISYSNNTTGRPAYTDNLVYQTSTNTLKTPHLLIEHTSGGQAEMHITYSTAIDYWWGVGTADENHGLYDNKVSKWILSAAADNKWTFEGSVTGHASLDLPLTGGTMTGDIKGNQTVALGTAANPFHNIVLGGATNTTMTAASTNPRITFQDGTGTQPVHLIYTDLDSYRYPAGLKVIGGFAATPAWFEVEGDVYGRSYYINNKVQLEYNSTDDSLDFIFA